LTHGRKAKCEGSSSFLKKRTKKLLLVVFRGRHDRHALHRTKVFCFFFSKKNCLLAGLTVNLQAAWYKISDRIARGYCQLADGPRDLRA
jgi:hypothetical protein